MEPAEHQETSFFEKGNVLERDLMTTSASLNES